MITLLVNVIGIFFVCLIIWWFWISKSRIASIKIENFIEIKVKDGVYQPASIEATANHLITLRFIREDASPCAETVVFSSLNISKQLPLHEPADLSLNIKKAGEYEFTCQMGMYRGKLTVK
jgi:plastocyanin domain-containing protein